MERRAVDQSYKLRLLTVTVGVTLPAETWDTCGTLLPEEEEATDTAEARLRGLALDVKLEMLWKKKKTEKAAISPTFVAANVRALCLSLSTVHFGKHGPFVFCEISVSIES